MEGSRTTHEMDFASRKEEAGLFLLLCSIPLSLAFGNNEEQNQNICSLFLLFGFRLKINALY